ncbi:hypothetical protein KZO83_05880 [Chromohalobacter sp. TMW 2.2308]|uniref:hypothetical protein n=1 Tax=Chromohalobacter TaxID=42054 RepID=UPI001FFD829D|nr:MULTISPECIES: hypothetical protein [Chromohalobacter]MCK2042213.1 hypothetical protein [Chromohalobacter moromii]MCT8514361.1 hypothetical protein [Chromohalobacter sp. TMW 2.2271]
MRRLLKTLLPKTLLGRLILGTGVGWSVLVIAILWVSLRGGSGLAEEINRAHLNYEASLIARNIQQSISLRLDTLKSIATSQAGVLQGDVPLAEDAITMCRHV